MPGLSTSLSSSANNASTFRSLYCIDFDGVDDYADTDSQISISGDFSISFWYKAVDTSPVFVTGPSSGIDDWILVYSNLLVAKINGDSYTATVSGSADNWYHGVFTRIGNTFSGYFNGALATPSSNGIDGADPFIMDYIGTCINGSVDAEGFVDEVTIWNSGLSANEVSAIYNYGSPLNVSINHGNYTSSSNLVHHWKMGDYDYSSTITDTIGGNNLTLQNQASIVEGAPNG